VRWGSGIAADAWRKRSYEQGGPCRLADGARPVAVLDRRARATCVVRARLAKQRGRGEADWWATTTVPVDGTDR
jgi:hypothetical protein